MSNSTTALRLVVAPRTSAEAHPGFSARLNQLLDTCKGLDIPALDEGRQAYVANAFAVSKVAAAEWLKKDTPPKSTTLRSIVETFMPHLKGSYNPLQIEAWLRYGESAVENPLGGGDSIDGEILMIVSERVKELGLTFTPGEEFMSVIASATLILTKLGVRNRNQLQPFHKKLIDTLLTT